MEEKRTEKIGDRIRKLLKESEYTQKELAQMCGVTESAMCRYLKNEREPKIEVIANIATALGTTVEYLTKGKDDEMSFERLFRLVARGTASMTEEEKKKLMKVLLEI